MHVLFRKTDELVHKIDRFLNLTREAGLHFTAALKLYLSGDNDEFEKRISIIAETERRADDMKKDIESRLYVQTLIPESRGDVLGILETMDRIVDNIKFTMMGFSIEKPVIPEPVTQGFLSLSEPVNLSIESLVLAVRAYFENINSVKDHLHLVKFYEKEADALSEKVKRSIFALDSELAVKLQLRDFAQLIDGLADEALNVADRLNIATIKRIV